MVCAQSVLLAEYVHTAASMQSLDGNEWGDFLTNVARQRKLGIFKVSMIIEL